MTEKSVTTGLLVKKLDRKSVATGLLIMKRVTDRSVAPGLLIKKRVEEDMPQPSVVASSPKSHLCVAGRMGRNLLDRGAQHSSAFCIA